MNITKLKHFFQGRLIVSCQAATGDLFDDDAVISRFARAAVAGGAAGIRANGARDIRAIREATSVPIIGIQKATHVDGKTLITGSFEMARDIVGAGANMVALDCTVRGQSYGAMELIRSIREELRVPVLADIATLDEALRAEEAGADFVLSTLRGYTDDTAHLVSFEPRFIADLVKNLTVPVIAEGRIHSPEQAREAISAGAYAVIVGTAITRPRDIARFFADAVESEFKACAGRQYFVGIDLGGTNTKYGVVSNSGEMLFDSLVPTPAMAGRQALLDTVKAAVGDARQRAAELDVAISGVGIATAGWVDSNSGRIAYATENLPGWTGTAVADEIETHCGLPVTVENDANALAAAERDFGAGRTFTDFVCITMGTGVGAGCFVGGRLNRGAHFFANALGHVTLVPDGLPCTCGQRGCLEAYCNASALIRYAGNGYRSAADVIQAANRGRSDAASAVRTLARYLAIGCGSLVQLLDPQALILSGGLATDNPGLLAAMQEELSRRVSAWERRHLIVATSELGYFGGVLGAAALARRHQ